MASMRPSYLTRPIECAARVRGEGSVEGGWVMLGRHRGGSVGAGASVVIDFRVEQEVNVFPMVPQNKSIGEMILEAPQPLAI